MINTEPLVRDIAKRVEALYNVKPSCWHRSVEFTIDGIDYIIAINYRVPIRYVDERRSY